MTEHNEKLKQKLIENLRSWKKRFSYFTGTKGREYNKGLCKWVEHRSYDLEVENKRTPVTIKYDSLKGWGQDLKERLDQLTFEGSQPDISEITEWIQKREPWFKKIEEAYQSYAKYLSQDLKTDTAESTESPVLSIYHVYFHDIIKDNTPYSGIVRAHLKLL
ncbi:MAG: hypothetical protein KDC80_15335, partial [Saprospiraceae bacterium]|nr:hypothetical protein [Saprospiraceae bacterium]